MEHRMKSAERTLERRAAGAEEDRRRAADMIQDRRRAEILLANFGKISRGASRVGLPDPFADSPRATVEIELDPSLSPDENAARLFQRAKKGERGERRALNRLTETRKSLSELAELRRETLLASPKEALRRLALFLSDASIDKSARGDVRETHLGRRAADAPRAGRPGRGAPGAHKSLRPRTYVTSDGWEVWVGRNNTDNDRITHRLSNPHDFWFHVVGVPGSHVILRRPTRNSQPRPTTLVEAAQIAAFFSKARKQTRVPVIYTERKFVSKPRKGKPGQALCTREREMIVRPLKPSTDPA
jgi:predicted ribosome quality control (RQC) complex YloA/Tae2 family protein